jgi:hypothetical protein
MIGKTMRALTAVTGLFLATFATAQAGTIVGNGTLTEDGGNPGFATVDLWYFSVASPGAVDIDIDSWEHDYSLPVGSHWVDLNGDGEAAFVDTSIFLYHDTGVLSGASFIDENGNNFVHGDSVYFADSFITNILPIGDYVVAVSTCCSFNVADVAGPHSYVTSDGTDIFQTFTSGDYEIVITGPGVTAIPEPSTVMLLALGAIGLVGSGRRRRR